MKGKTARFIFLLVCILLAFLLLTNIIDTVVSGSIFTLALILLSGLSREFRKI